MHHAYQTGPIYLGCTSQLARFCVAQPRQIVRVKRVSDFIESTAGGATRREHQHRSEVRAHGAANHARPERSARPARTARLNKLGIRQISEISFLQRHRSRLMFDEDGVTPDAL